MTWIWLAQTVTQTPEKTAPGEFDLQLPYQNTLTSVKPKCEVKLTGEQQRWKLILTYEWNNFRNWKILTARSNAKNNTKVLAGVQVPKTPILQRNGSNVKHVKSRSWGRHDNRFSISSKRNKIWMCREVYGELLQRRNDSNEEVNFGNGGLHLNLSI